MPLRARTRAVAAFVSANAARMTQPVNRATVPRFAPSAANRAGSGALEGAASGMRSSSSARRRRPMARSTARMPRRLETYPNRANSASRAGDGKSPWNTARRSTASIGPGRRAATTWERAASMSFPNDTPEGQAVSQARQSRHLAMWSANAGLSASRRSSQTFFMSRIRPRGESISTPSSAKVGHVGRQSPQWTQREMSSGSGASAFGKPSRGVNRWPIAPARGCPSGRTRP